MPPVLETRRLLLRSPEAAEAADAPALAMLAADRRIADTTATVPHPYALADAESFIGHARDIDSLVWAIVRRADADPLGVISLHPTGDRAIVELGYWIRVPHWGQGFATEAAVAVIEDAFRRLAVATVLAEHLVRNPASHRVMLKAGMREKGIRRGRSHRWGVPEDHCDHSQLQQEWQRAKPAEAP